MNFFKNILNSLYSPSFYASIPQKTFGQAISYFLLLILLLTVLKSASPIYNYLSSGQKQVSNFLNQAINFYPEELKIKIKNGKVSTNVQEPYFIPLTLNLDRKTSSVNLAVIDTKTPFSTAQFNKYQTIAIAWITSDSVVTRDDKGQIRIYDLAQVSDLTINKQLVDTLLTKITPWFKLITPLVVTGILFGFFLLNALRLIYLLILAILVLLLTKIIKKPLSWRNSYKVGLYAMTLGFFVEIALGWFRLSGFPFMFTLITLLVVLVNFLNIPESPQTTAPQTD